MRDEKDQPPVEQLELGTLFAALADPLRRAIVAELLAEKEGVARQCSSFHFGVSKSTMTHHFRVLREAGLISQIDYGNRREVVLRRSEVERRFPGLLALLDSAGPRAATSLACRRPRVDGRPGKAR